MPFIAGNNDRSLGFETRLLAAHNRERALLGVSPLGWDDRLADEARAWASQVARSRRLSHAKVYEEGENLWIGTAGSFSPEQMVGAWIDEKQDYRHGVFPAVSRTGDWTRVGHYTQLIWSRTRRVGCAVAANGAADVLVCRYAAPGNIIGERPI